MKSIGFLVACILIWSPHAVKSEQLDAEFIKRVNNLQHELTRCVAFVETMKHCSRKSHPENKAWLTTWSDKLLRFAYDAGKAIKMSDDAMGARLRMEQKDMSALIKDNCVNVSSAMDRYLDKCSQLGKNPSKYLESK